MPITAITNNYLEACQSWQRLINAESAFANKSIVAREALVALKDQCFYGQRNVVVDGEVALYIPDGTTTFDEKLWPIMQFGQIVTRGWLARLSILEMENEVVLAWGIYDPNVIGPVEEVVIEPQACNKSEDQELYHLPIDRSLRRPLHFPVGLINYAVCYGR